MPDVKSFVADFVSEPDALVLFSPSTSFYQSITDLEDCPPIVVVDDDNDVDATNFVQLPLEFDNVKDRVRFGVEGALDKDVIGDGDQLLCLTSIFNSSVDTILELKANKDEHLGVYDLFVNSRAEGGVIRDVIEVAVELGKKGQKGEPVGALFVVGDAGKVMNKSRPISYNPFEKSHVHVGDPIVTVMLKEFSRLDGAFIISDAGKIVSAYRYLEPSAEGIDIPKGLGARHMAAGAITQETSAIAIVLSESDGLVRAFKGGELVLELDPEDY